jgi:predicted deacylase
MHIGNIEAMPGELVQEYLPVAEHPTGGHEQLPIAIAEGAEEGPTLWVVATIHGNEVTPMAVAQDLMKEVNPASLAGTVVSIPVMNPAGLRRNERTSYYHDHDPNRFFPDATGGGTKRPPKIQEVINYQVFDAMEDDGDAVISLHSAQVGAIPYVVRPRVPYGSERSRNEANQLADEIDRLVRAFGLPTLQYEEREYVERNLQRTTAGSVIENLDIPSFTPELGTTAGMVVDKNREAGLIGVQNVMREMDMLQGEPVANDVTSDAPVDYPVKRPVDPTTDTAGILRLRVQPGEEVTAGETIADIVDPFGDRKSTVEADYDGYVISHHHGVAVYKNDTVAHMAGRDDEELVRYVGE